MKILLIDNVKNVGQRGSILNVADGLARNKLIPEKKAVEVTESNIAKFASVLTPKKRIDDIPVDDFKKYVETLSEGIIIIYKSKADKSGSLYKSIHEDDIVGPLKAAMPSRFHTYISKDRISFDSVIKRVGEYKGIFFGGVFNFTLRVES